MIVDNLRADVRSQAARIEDCGRQYNVQTGAQLLAILQQSIDKSNGRISWIRVQNREGETIAIAGRSGAPTFATREIQTHLRSRQPLFQTVNGDTGGRVLFDATAPVLPGFAKAPAFVF